LNIAKSHAKAVGSWDTMRTVMNIPYSTEVKVLGIQMANTTAQLVADYHHGETPGT
jgi:hypothetical protein